MLLEFATTQELIDELMRRTTFAGLVLCSSKEHKNPNTFHDDLRLFTTADAESTLAILEKALASMQKRFN